MNSISCQTAKLTFIDENSAQIFKKKEHVLIGISPFNSYYSRAKIEQILIWVLEQGFKDFHFFLADEIYHYNFLMMGYSMEKAQHETKKQDRYLYNKVMQNLEKYGVDEEKIIKYTDFKIQKKYQDKYIEYKQKLKHSLSFQKILEQTISNLNFKTSHLILTDDYIFAELPFILDTPALFNVQSSCFVYHQNNDLYTYLFAQKNQTKMQGFIALNF